MSPILTRTQSATPRVAVLIPCLNEEKTIGKVVRDFRSALREAEIIVFDNASTDATAREACAAGATVLLETRRGKGFVVQSMFQRVEADVFVIVDGDDTYPADRVKSLLDPILNDEADMVVGSRIGRDSQSEFRWVNLVGNKVYQWVINTIFGTQLTDILSGYRALHPRLVRGLPIFVTGFEVEAELTVKALERGYRVVEVPVELGRRPQGSHSKIRIVHDGFKILWTILALFRDYKPLTVFGSLGAICIVLGFLPGLIAVTGFLQTGLVLHFPSAILAVGLVITGMMFVTVGLILHTVNRRFQEMAYYMRLMIEHIQ